MSSLKPLENSQRAISSGDDDRREESEGQREPDHSRSHRRRGKKLRNMDEDVVTKLLGNMTKALKENTMALNMSRCSKDQETKLTGTPYAPLTKEEKVTVEVRIGYKKIIDVDTVRQLFKAEIFIQARWPDPKLANLTKEELSKIKFENIWKPDIAVLNNADAGLKISTKYSISHNQPGYHYPVIVMYKDIKGVFTETLELEDFPCDVQELTVQVCSKRSVEEVELVADRCEMSLVDINSCLDQDEWTLYQHVESTNIIRHEELPDGHGVLTPCIDFSCSVKRNPRYYVWNIMFIMFLVTTLRFTAYSEVPSRFHARLTITFTLLLTCVSFKSTIKQSLPPISYLTYLDIYIIISITLMAIQSIQMAAMALLLYDTDLMIQIDSYCLYVLAAIHLLLQFVYVIFMCTIYYRGKSKLDAKDRRYLKQRSSCDSLASVFTRSKKIFHHDVKNDTPKHDPHTHYGYLSDEHRMLNIARGLPMTL